MGLIFSEFTDINECSSGPCGTDSLCQNYHGGLTANAKFLAISKSTSMKRASVSFVGAPKTHVLFVILPVSLPIITT